MKLFNSAHKAAMLIFAFIPALTFAGLPDPGMSITKGRTALVVTDPQNDFLSPEGATWGLQRNPLRP